MVESKKGDESTLALQHLQKANSLGLPSSVKSDAEELEAKLSRTPGPSYADTVRYIQGRLGFALEDRSECSFVYHSGNGPMQFSAANLVPHVEWNDPFDHKSGMINCAGGKSCVHFRRSDNVDIDFPYWNFKISDSSEKTKMEKALIHMLDLCGVRPENPDLF